MRSRFHPSCAFVSAFLLSTVAVATPEELPGTSGLCIEATVALTLRTAGNGSSSNGSSDTTPRRPRKRPRDPDPWKRAMAKAKRNRGEQYTSSTTGKVVEARKTDNGPHSSPSDQWYGRPGVNAMSQILHRPHRELTLLSLPMQSMILQMPENLRQMLMMLCHCFPSYQDVIQVTDYLGIPCKIVSIALWNTASAEVTPNGRRVYLYNP